MFLLLANDGNRVAVRGHIIVRRGPCPALKRTHTPPRESGSTKKRIQRELHEEAAPRGCGSRAREPLLRPSGGTVQGNMDVLKREYGLSESV